MADYASRGRLVRSTDAFFLVQSRPVYFASCPGFSRQSPLFSSCRLVFKSCRHRRIDCLFDVHVPLLWYPVAVNIALLCVFAFSVLAGRPIVETFARLALKDKPFPPEAVRYTRKVTFVWIVFFAINGSIAAWTALKADPELWTLWNGCLSYVCIGLVAGGEYLVRRRVCKN